MFIFAVNQKLHMFKKYFTTLFCCMVWLCVPEVRASHLVGADIIYKCLGNNQYELTFVLYQDCLTWEQQSAIGQDAPLKFGIFTGSDKSLFFHEGAIYDYTEESIVSEFTNECINNIPATCLQQQSFKTIVTLPPNNTGYRVIYQRCCRNQNITNIIFSGNVGVSCFVDIPPSPSGNCVNNSAVFRNFPPQIICLNNPFRYDFSAADPDGDSLSYRLCDAYPGASPQRPIPEGHQMEVPQNPIDYMPPYSANNPVNGNPGITIHPVTGILSGTPSEDGRYVVTVCVDEWRNGIIINTISRDIQLTITNCSRTTYADMPSWGKGDKADIYTIECHSNTVAFRNTSYGGFAYLWKFGYGNATSTEFEPTHTYPDKGIYEVTLIVNPGTTCVDSIKKLVYINPSMEVDFTTDGNLCPGTPLHFQSVVSSKGDSIKTYNWFFDRTGTLSGAPSATFTFPAPGGEKQVTLVTESYLGCVDTVSKILPIDHIEVYAGSDTVLVKNYPYRFNGRGAESYRWEPETYLSDPFSPQPTVTFPDSGTYVYYLHGNNASGCEDVDTIVIRVALYPHMFLPNAFSPNGDGLNDVLKPEIIGYALVNTFEVFDRYGQLVYKSANNNNFGWDGTYLGRPADVGVYFYRVTYTDPFSAERHVKTGDVTLVR